MVHTWRSRSAHLFGGDGVNLLSRRPRLDLWLEVGRDGSDVDQAGRQLLCTGSVSTLHGRVLVGCVGEGEGGKRRRW